MSKTHRFAERMRDATVILLLIVFTSWAHADDAPREKWVAPPSAARTANPVPITPSSVKAGMKVFNNNCTSCHGPSGRGDGLLAGSLPIKPANLNGADIWSQTDGSLFWKISTGRAPMPNWDPSLEEEDRWNVINYMRTTFAGNLPMPVAAAPQGTAPAPQAGQDDNVKLIQQLLANQARMQAEIDQLRAARGGSTQPGAATMPDNGATTPLPPIVMPVLPISPTAARQEDMDYLSKEVDVIKKDLDRTRLGTEGFLLVGDAHVDWASTHGNTSSFGATASPLILFKPYDYFLFEAGFDLTLTTNSDTTSSSGINLSIADAAFFVNDWLTVGAGEFATPFGVYHNHFDPPWIYKFADDPLPWGDNPIAPGSSLGIFARGAQLIGNSKITYDIYASNGPNLITNDKTAAGTLAFDDWGDLNNDKTIGGRLGLIPIPNMEMGYSVMSGKANPAGGFPSTHFLLQAVDLNYRPDVPELAGTFDFRTEWIWSNVERVTYDPTGSAGFGPLSYSNYRSGGYVQLCYRPTHQNNPFLSNIEFCGRWDFLKIPDVAPGGGSEQRWTIGVDYWINPQAVLKFDYEFDRRSSSLGPQQSGLLMELGLGL